jgi:hypothetical protein
MKVLWFILIIANIIFAQIKSETFNLFSDQNPIQLKSRKNCLLGNISDFYYTDSNSSNIFIAYTGNSYVQYYSFKDPIKMAFSDSSSKKSRKERSLERKNRRLQELADRYTIDELKQKINNYNRSKTSGTVLMGVGIPIFAAGLVSTIVGLNNVDRSNSNSSDGGWAVTALVGEVVAVAGGILTAYGIIKMSKANSRINKYQELLEIKTKDVGIRIDRKGLSLSYHF